MKKTYFDFEEAIYAQLVLLQNVNLHMQFIYLNKPIFGGKGCGSVGSILSLNAPRPWYSL